MFYTCASGSSASLNSIKLSVPTSNWSQREREFGPISEIFFRKRIRILSVQTNHLLIGVQPLYPLFRLFHEKDTTHFTPFKWWFVFTSSSVYSVENLISFFISFSYISLWNENETGRICVKKTDLKWADNRMRNKLIFFFFFFFLHPQNSYSDIT